ncbi:MAG: dehypoxanthine futalosine cyclase, partial [Bacteroidia bacterium]|nr:dehypoxanthine futalosine cyclase [Bacteroidia bacterium]
MEIKSLLDKALKSEFLTAEEGQYLFENAALGDLMEVAHKMRLERVPAKKVTWIIDRNVNTTNVCIANCKFCNFYRIPG